MSLSQQTGGMKALMKSIAFKYLPGIAVVLLIYVFYKAVYSSSSWTLLFPLFILGAIAWGETEFRMYKRRCLANCYFRENSLPYNLLHRNTMAVLISLCISTVYALSLMTFIALGAWIDFVFLITSALLVTVLYHLLLPVNNLWGLAFVSKIFARRMAVWLCFCLLLPLYLWISFNTKIPDYVDPTSLSNTIAGASAQVGILCSFTNYVVKFVHELHAVFFYYATTASLKVDPPVLRFLIWFLFFIKSSFVFLAMSRFSIEVISRLSDRLSDKQSL